MDVSVDPRGLNSLIWFTIHKKHNYNRKSKPRIHTVILIAVVLRLWQDRAPNRS